MKSAYPVFSANENLIYLDSAATSQIPQVVIDELTKFTSSENASVHRGLYPLAVSASERYEASRKIVADFIGAQQNEIIFTSGTTESLNGLAQMLLPFTKNKKNIVITQMEHHANLIPWQQLAKRANLKLDIIPIKKDYTLDMVAAKKLITKNTAVAAFTHISNTLGTQNNVKALSKICKDAGCISVIDGAQSIAHVAVDVKKIGCDFFVFSGHKVYGPTGIGVLYGREELLTQLEPYKFGGNMVESVTFTDATWGEIPHKFEAGTTPYAQAIGLASAFNFLSKKTMAHVQERDESLTSYALTKLHTLKEVELICAKKPVGIISFIIKGIHPHDIADMLGEKNICVRGGHHCTMPLHKELGLTGTTRLSFGLYNTKKEIDTFIKELQHIIEVFK